MSSQNATLDQDWAARARQQTTPEVQSEPETKSLREKALEGGARYGKPSGRASKTVRGPSNECLTCGATIPTDIARVVGDEEGCTPVCGDCDEKCRNTVPAVESYYAGGSR